MEFDKFKSWLYSGRRCQQSVGQDADPQTRIAVVLLLFWAANCQPQPCIEEGSREEEIRTVGKTTFQAGLRALECRCSVQ